MLKITKTSPHHLDVELSGRLDSAGMEAGLDELTAAAETIENGTMLYDIVDFSLPSLGAVAIECSRLPALFGLIKRFTRVAVLTDREWLKKASEFEGMLIPGLDIRAFSRDQRVEAEAWLSAGPASDTR